VTTLDEIALVDAFYESTKAGDMERTLSLLSEDIRWSVPETLPYGGTYEGLDGFRRYRAGIQEAFNPGYQFLRAESFHSDGDVIILGRLVAEAKATGIKFESPFVHVWTVRGDKIVARHYYVDTRTLLHGFTGEEQPGADVAARDEQVVRGVYEATMAGDRERVFELLDENVEWKIPESLPYGGRFEGHAGVTETRRIANEHFVPGQTFSQDHVFRSVDNVVVVGRMRATAQATGQELDVPFAHIWTVHDGKVVARHQYTDTGAILSALGG
jgi:ketosteroid isomerase-like protein